MFYYLEGKVALCQQNLVVIDCHGVGYAVATSMYTLGNIKTGEVTKIYTYLSVREDAMELFGFSTQEELNCFKMLISISGVGPKAAISILSATTPSGLALAIASEDEKVLTNAQGVGKKLAGRIILELKDKMKKSASNLAGGDPMTPLAPGNNTHGAEAMEALMVLGYSKPEAIKAISRAPEGSSVEDIIKYALKNLVIPY